MMIVLLYVLYNVLSRTRIWSSFTVNCNCVSVKYAYQALRRLCYFFSLLRRVGSQNNMVQYHTVLRAVQQQLRQDLNCLWIHKRNPLSHPHENYVVYIVSILEKIDLVIKDHSVTWCTLTISNANGAGELGGSKRLTSSWIEELLNFYLIIKCPSFNVWVRYFVWNFKVYLWNSTQNISPIHWKIWFLYNVKILRAVGFKSS